MGFIILEKRKIFYADIENLFDKSHLSSYSNLVIDFCLAWFKNQPSFNIQTSGSTGEPQTIQWPRALMQWNIHNTAKALHLKEGMHCLLCMDIRKAGGMMMMARALELGMSIEVVEPSANPLEHVISSEFDLAAMVPLQIHHLYQQNKLQELQRIKILLIGGASISQTLTEALQSISTRVYATYGMTETASHIALQRINGDNKQKGFRVMPDVNINTGPNGCAIIETPFHSSLVTHDMIQFNVDDSFIVLGRSDDIVNSGGIKINIHEVEEAVDETLTAMKLNFFNFCAWKRNSEKLGEELILLFETDAWDESMTKEFKLLLAERLTRYQLPKQIYFIPKLQYTASGKIDRIKSLRQLF